VRPEQADLVARKVRDSTAHLYAAKSYLDRRGRPKGFDLTNTVLVGSDDNPRFVEVLRELGANVTLESFRWTTDSHLVGWEMVKRGLGVGAMIREVAEATPNVEQVLTKLVIPVPYWLCTHRELYTSRRIRVTYDLLAEALAGELPIATRARVKGRRRESTR
jgi:DNA-binding transcriptional LysR family regulator